MKAIMTARHLASDLVTTVWTPIFVGDLHRHRRSTRSGRATRPLSTKPRSMPLREE